MTDLDYREAPFAEMTEEAFEDAESVIRRGFTTFVEVGQALLEIRIGRGYVHAGYATFEDYCQQRWDMRHQNADRLIRSAEVAGMLNPIGFTLTESQAREMAPLLRTEPERIAEVWQEALETAPNGNVTAAHVAAVVEKTFRPVPEPESRPMRETPLLRFCQNLPTPTIVSLILRVFFPDAVTALDLTYGSGAFWDGSAHVTVTAHDTDPSRAPHGVVDFMQAQRTYARESHDVVLFDPPHLADTGESSIMGQRYGTYSNAELAPMIIKGTRVAWSLARLGLIVKVTDHVHGHEFQHETGWVTDALDGLKPYDVVHQVRNFAMEAPQWGEQLSAYNNGSTYLIYRRGDPKHIRREGAR